MKTLLLLILGFVILAAVWAFGVGVCFAAGGIVTKLFHASDTGLALFILSTIAWTIWLLKTVWRDLQLAGRG